MTTVLNGQAIWTPAYIALGSNLEQPEVQVRRALQQLTSLSQSAALRCSSLYCSVPMGSQDQPMYVNAVAGLLTRLSAEELLTQLQRIEQSLGRKPAAVRWGPRIIDLDLLLFGGLRCDTPKLKLPHPGMLERNFVLTPLADVAPQLQLPNDATVMQMAAWLGADGLEKLA